jgi:hypothetical protein
MEIPSRSGVKCSSAQIHQNKGEYQESTVLRKRLSFRRRTALTSSPMASSSEASSWPAFMGRPSSPPHVMGHELDDGPRRRGRTRHTTRFRAKDNEKQAAGIRRELTKESRLLAQDGAFCISWCITNGMWCRLVSIGTRECPGRGHVVRDGMTGRGKKSDRT